MASDSKQGGFTVTDRRSFAQGDEGEGKGKGEPTGKKPEGSGVPEESGSSSSAAGDTDRTPTSGPAAAAGPSTSGRDAAALPAVDFHTFVLSLGSSALLHLGELEHPDSGETEKDLSLAKHTIDILSMLQEKTKGNLTPAEDKLMESLLYDLRLRYVNASK
jgi:hypothetical protein